jgi:ribonuclease HII
MNDNITCGIDEAGRGALAGPLFAAAVLLSPNELNKIKKTKLIIRDSKLLSPSQREKIYSFIKKQKIPYFTKKISVKRINNHGIQSANVTAIRNLIKQIDADNYIVDGNLKLGHFYGKIRNIKCIPHADRDILCVTFAGIIAKVKRDMYMKNLHQDFPNYGWFRNSGYGTQLHIRAIIKFGISSHHRKIFVDTAIGHFREKSGQIRFFVNAV